jgi:hypothetical protein
MNKTWNAIFLGVLLAASVSAADKQKTFTGTVKSVEWKERQFELADLKEKITVGAVCAVTLPDKSPGNYRDLGIGEKVTVKYHEANGVQMADRIDIEQRLQDDGDRLESPPAPVKARAVAELPAKPKPWDDRRAE